MSNPSAGDGDGKNHDGAVAKTAGFVVFSGIAMSILKALNPCKTPNLHQSTNNATESVLTESTQALKQPQSLPPQEPIIKKPITCDDDNVPMMPKTVEIVRGDTLWGLSKKYGVSIQEIKEANGLTGDTIYAGKKLVIP